MRKYRLIKALAPILPLFGTKIERVADYDRMGYWFFVIPPKFGKWHRYYYRFFISHIEALHENS